MKYKQISITKDDPKSKILGESISVFLEPRQASVYIGLIKSTWPETTISTRFPA
jgi:hypothetical protein